MGTLDTFSSRLRALREERGLTQGQLGEALKVSRGSISFYEIGSRVPDIETLSTMSQFFGCTSDYLLGLSENRFPQNIGIGKILGLSDEAIEIIQNINEPEFSDNLISISESCVSKTKLLNETIEHPLFSTILHYLQTAHFCYNSKNESINITIGPEKSSIESGRGLSLKAGQVAEFYQRIAIDLFSRLTEYLVFDLEEGEE